MGYKTVTLYVDAEGLTEEAFDQLDDAVARIFGGYAIALHTTNEVHNAS